MAKRRTVAGKATTPSPGAGQPLKQTNKPPPTKSWRLQIHDWASIVTVISGLVGLPVVLFTAYQIYIDLADRSAERESRALETLTRLDNVGAGKAAALGYLVGAGANLDNLDISCARLDGSWDDATLNCRREPDFRAARIVVEPTPFGKFLSLLGAEKAQDTLLTNWNISGANFQYSVFQGVALRRFDMRGAILRQANFQSTWIEGDFTQADFRGADIARAKLSGSVAKAMFYGANISGTQFSPDAVVNLNGAIAWADQPPTKTEVDFTPEELDAAMLCDPAGRKTADQQPRTPCRDLTGTEAVDTYPWAFALGY